MTNTKEKKGKSGIIKRQHVLVEHFQNITCSCRFLFLVHSLSICLSVCLYIIFILTSFLSLPYIYFYFTIAHSVPVVYHSFQSVVIFPFTISYACVCFIHSEIYDGHVFIIWHKTSLSFILSLLFVSFFISVYSSFSYSSAKDLFILILWMICLFCVSVYECVCVCAVKYLIMVYFSFWILLSVWHCNR